MGARIQSSSSSHERSIWSSREKENERTSPDNTFDPLHTVVVVLVIFFPRSFFLSLAFIFMTSVTAFSFWSVTIIHVSLAADTIASSKQVSCSRSILVFPAKNVLNRFVVIPLVFLSQQTCREQWQQGCVLRSSVDFLSLYAHVFI